MKKVLGEMIILMVIFTSAQADSLLNGVAGNDIPPELPIPIITKAVKGIVAEQGAEILDPESIEFIRKKSSAARKEGIYNYPDHFIAKPVNRPIKIEPNITQQPRLIRLSMGMITSLVFSDNSGNPWLVKSVDYDESLFKDPRGANSSSPTVPIGVGEAAGSVVSSVSNSSAQLTPQSAAASEQSSSNNSTNIVKIAPITQYSYGNITIELEGLTAPVVFILAAGQSVETDIRIDARIVGRNPNAKSEIISSRNLPDHDGCMSDFLDGVAPSAATQLKVSGGIADAWQLGTALYVRTRMSMLSPAFTDHVGSADGMHVYKFYSVIPSVLASVNGVPTTLYFSGY